MIKVWNDGKGADSLQLAGTGSATGFTVKYLQGASGSNDITAAVTAGTYHTASLAPGNGAVLRLVVTIAANAPAGVTRDWLLTATSQHDSTAQDAVDAQIKTQ